jgi:hypothetical protein
MSHTVTEATGDGCQTNIRHLSEPVGKTGNTKTENSFALHICGVAQAVKS